MAEPTTQAQERHVQVVSRLTAVEASAKQAHHRLDSLEGKMTEK